MVHFLEHFLAISILVILWAIVAGVLFDAYEFAQKRRRQRHRRARLVYERYAAERAVHDAKRHALRDLLDAERLYREPIAAANVIEGTAVEIEPR
jgi:hypothetical protein